MKSLLLFILVLLSASAAQAAGAYHDRQKAVILAYYRVGEDMLPGSSIRADQFAEHVREMVRGGYTVLPVPEILRRLKAGEDLPPQTLGITFQGAYRSVLDRAVPLLTRDNLPFTIFLAPETAGARDPQFMSWKDLAGLKDNKLVTLGLTPAQFESPKARQPVENRRMFNKALTTFRERLKMEPALFAYPFGEYDAAYKSMVEDHGFSGAFALQSGPVYEGADFAALPRFVLTERYGDLERFQIVANTLPLPVKDVEPQVTLLDNAVAPIGFTIPEDRLALIPELRCYASGQGQIEPEILGRNRVELRPDLTPEERLRVNCTAPVYNGKARRVDYRWLGFFLTAGKASSPAPISAEISSPEQGVLQ